MEQNHAQADVVSNVRGPEDVLFGTQTQQAVNNFPISGIRFPRSFIRAIGMIKCAAAEVNQELGELDKSISTAIQNAAKAVAEGKHDDQFPVDIFQTGSGTSTNMNANEVIATLASRELGTTVHPNDHVNMSQSSNDVIPTAIHLSANLMIAENLLPAMTHLEAVISKKSKETDEVVKTGRTHLMDAMPLRMSQELSGWSSQISDGIERVDSSMSRLQQLAIGGTAVGTGVNAPRNFGPLVASRLSVMSSLSFTVSENYFKSLSCQDAVVEMSGQLRTVAVSLMKISNDLRWMNSGPSTGIGEIQLAELQPGSSIMPGKINPVIPEAVAMVCAQVMGNDLTISIAGQSGNFQLNVMLPVVAHNL